MNDHRRAVLLKNSVRLGLVTQIPVLGAQKHVGLGLGSDGVYRVGEREGGKGGGNRVEGGREGEGTSSNQRKTNTHSL